MLHSLAPLAAYIALVTAISILTIASFTLLNGVTSELFKEVEKKVKIDIKGNFETKSFPKYEHETAQKARDLVRKFPTHILMFYCFASIGPAFLVGAYMAIDFSHTNIGVPRLIDIQNSITITWLVKEGFPFSIAVYFVYCINIILRVARIKVNYFRNLPNTWN